MLAVGKYLILARQVRAARIDQVYTRQADFAGNLLCPQVLLDRDGMISAAFDGRVIADHETFAPPDASRVGNQAVYGCLVVVQTEPGQLRELQKWTAGVQ